MRCRVQRARTNRRRATPCLQALVTAVTWVVASQALGAEDDPFALPIVRVVASPNARSRAPVPASWHVEGLAASPSEPEVALLLSRGESEPAIHLWRSDDAATTPVDVGWPAGFEARTDASAGALDQPLAWHPIERRLYVAGSAAGRGVIVTIFADSGRWTAARIADVGEAARALLVGPRP